MKTNHSSIGRWVAAALALGVLGVIFFNLIKDVMPKGEVRKVADYQPWSAETVRVAEAIPVQDGGRVKPLSTYAGFTMLGLHGARSMEIADKSGTEFKISPTEWLLDTLYRPQLAVQMPTFRIDNSAVLEAIGVKPKGKRDRYSYSDLQSGRPKLLELAKTYSAIPSEKQDPLQSQTLALETNVQEYESLLGYFYFARNGVVLRDTGTAGQPDRRANFSAVMASAPELRRQLAASSQANTPMEPRIQDLLQQAQDAANYARAGLFPLPPENPKQEKWLSAGDEIYSTLTEGTPAPELAMGDMAALEMTAQTAALKEADFRKSLTSLRDRIAARATARGEGKHVALEADFYRRNWFLNALGFFILGTLGSFAMLAVRKGRAAKILSWATLGATATGLAMCIIAIVIRCIIMRRPPVGNLYDTIIFIATTVVLVALLVESMTRRRFALAIAPVLGALLIILARRFEVGDAKDNMDPLVAVLNSNYWLTIHVLTITLGYAAGLFSAFLAFIYLLMRGLRLVDDDREIRRSLTKAVYGMVCLTLFLSLVGTVLGGIWANDSWGRFWGWDPKENGALLIVLWTLSILHARLGGYIREWGLHLAAIFTAAVVTFSWWHVNFLGVGLHSYGFATEKDSLWIFYKMILGILVLGFIARAADVHGKSAPRPKRPPPHPEAEPQAY